MKNKIRWGTDIDGVLANFSQAFIERAREIGLSEHVPCCWRHVEKWMFTDKFEDIWSTVKDDHGFWLNIKPFDGVQESMVVVPDLYLTSRPISNDITVQWLRKHNFPEAETVTVCAPSEKLAVIRERNIQVFVDDLIPTVNNLRESGIDAYLYAAPYQCETDHSHLPKIHSLREVAQIVANDGEPSLKSEIDLWVRSRRSGAGREARV